MNVWLAMAYIFMSVINLGSALFNDVGNPSLDKIFVINGVLLLIPLFKLAFPGKKS